MKYSISAHANQQASDRGIALSMIEEIMINPDRILDDPSGEDEQKVYQSCFAFSNQKTYLVRVFVNFGKQPPVVKTVYRTSQLNKHL